MHCPACNADNPADVPHCTACGGALTATRPPSSRVRRAVAEESDSPFSGLGEGPNRAARLAYLVVLAALVPGVGLVLGPVAAVLGLLARRRRFDPGFTAHGPALAAVVLGILTTLTNWGGLALMVVGWRQP
jgi:hypothetical protein